MALDQFVNLYPATKTLRFELKPIGSDGNTLTAEEATNLFKDILEEDKRINAAYIALKPVMDKIHETVINTSLTSDRAKKIDFSEYFEKYKQREKTNEESLRKSIVATFDIGVQPIKEKAGADKNGKPALKKEGIKCLTEAGILKYIGEIIREIPDEKERKNLEEYLKVFEKFYTYFSGYNQNRENYYSEEEKATAVATRIINDNLSKFCDNCIQFTVGNIKQKKKKSSNNEKQPVPRKDEYLNTYQFLKSKNIETKIKDAKTNDTIEAYPINEKMFEITKFSECLSQPEIEEYNRIIGHYNILINLHNQARKEEKDFKKLEPFKTLYKQIGCGKRDSLFYALKYDTKQEQQANGEMGKILNLEDTLNAINQAGKKHFRGNINSFIDWLEKKENWEGIYWSKTAVAIISTIYLVNWHDIKDRIQQGLIDKEKIENYKSIASYDKRREEQLKLNDAVELSGLFEVLNESVNWEENKDWSEAFFKDSILEEKKPLIDESKTPSQNLINLICADIKNLAKNFGKKSSDILEITDYKDEKNILEIKEWLDTAISIIRIIKYFNVKESKVKGNAINSELSNMLSSFLYADDTNWFEWYNIVRNYLTRKPQDNAKENKLKLNFKNPVLLGGWSDGQEKNKGAILIKNNKKYYVGILSDRSIFDTSKKNNPIYKATDKNIGRLILRNLKFKTLAGKGFKGKFNESYGNIGKQNPQEAVEKLQQFIREHPNYLTKYPLLQPFVNKKYSDKKIFDKEINEVLEECYDCDFIPIDWNKVMEYIKNGKLYLFEIYSKDFGEKSTGKPNLQTKYWEHIFQKNSTIQLCGGGEFFFREKAITDDKIDHPANKPIYRRSDGKTGSLFSHDIIKDKRFKSDKYFFHIPIKINYQASSKPNINEMVSDVLAASNDIQFLGIDRGEKHLIYYSLVDANGNIIEQNHFDVINKKDYLEEINDAAAKRREKQENWQQKGNIKNLKDGYISLVIHEIIEKMKDKKGHFKPTFIVLEALNTGFKRNRQKFEQQVYQKFELALAKKLNYLVDKNVKNIDGIGSVAKALQLTPPVANYQDIENRKQVGIMLYTRANYTSITDPATGWRKTIYLKKGAEKEIEKEICDNFTDIGFDGRDYYFEYEYINEENGFLKKWKLWSGKDGNSLERYRFRRGKNKNERIIEPYNIKRMLDKLFENLDKNESLLKQLKDGKQLSKLDKQFGGLDKHTAWESLRFVIDLIQQIRNSGDTDKRQDDNFLLSPARNDEGKHFDSRNQEDSPLPKDADANGAYNIARKGIIMHEHIKQWIKDGKQKYDKSPDLDLFISDKEWDLWLLDRDEWQKQLPTFASRKKWEK